MPHLTIELPDAMARELDSEAVRRGVDRVQLVRDAIATYLRRAASPERPGTPESPRGTPGRDLLRFAGTLDSADLAAMARAIEEGCEAVDPNEW
jgi:hypothetical protein